MALCSCFLQQDIFMRPLYGLLVASQLVRGKMKREITLSDFTKAFPVNPQSSQLSYLISLKKDVALM